MTTASPPFPSPTILDCGDTPLSTTASIVGILTFALGLAASYIALQSATRGAPSEIARLVDELRSTQSEINRLAEYIFDDAHQDDGLENAPRRIRFLGDANPPYVTPGEQEKVGKTTSSGWTVTTSHIDAAPSAALRPLDALYAETQALLSSCIRLFYETDRLLKRSKSDNKRWDPEGLRRRIVYVMNRHKLDEKIQRLAEQKQKLGSVQMTLFMRKSAAQDTLLRDMRRKLEEVERKLDGKLGASESSEGDSGISAGRYD